MINLPRLDEKCAEVGTLSVIYHTSIPANAPKRSTVQYLMAEQAPKQVF